MRSVLSSAFSWLVGLVLAGVVYLIATHGALAQDQPVSADPEGFQSENLLNPGYVMPVSLEDSVNSLDTIEDTDADDDSPALQNDPSVVPVSSPASNDENPSVTEHVPPSQAAGVAGAGASSLTPDSARGAGITRGTNKAPVAATDSEEGTSTAEKRGVFDGLSLSYFGILHGPAVGDISAYQPKATGGRDLKRPIFTQNYINVSKELTDDVALTAQGYWVYQPVLNQNVEMLDPSLRISNNRMIDSNGFTLYSDLRAHFPVSSRSRNQDMRFGVQTFQVATYTADGSRFTFGAFGSFRYNFFGPEATGRKIELYGAPNIAYQISPKLAFTALYELGATNFANDPSGLFYSDGTDIEPGLRWDVTESFSVSPYLTLMINDRVNLKTTTFGMMVNWVVL